MMELLGGRYETAVRSLGEALKRDPTDLSSISRMRQAMGSLGRKDAAKGWFDRWTAVRASIDANNLVAKQSPPDPESVEDLAEKLEALDRPLEAILWRAMVAPTFGGKEYFAALNQQRKNVLERDLAFPDVNSRICGLELGEYALPDRATLAGSLNIVVDQSHDEDAESEVVDAYVSDVARSIGLKHTYRVASEPQENRFAIHQTLGGGVAILDHDLDGNPDIYLAQGAADPPEFEGDIGNQLLRNLQSKLDDISSSANVADKGYSLGVTAGDWNQDGLPDLCVANIGSCVLLINQGDGTFQEQLLDRQANSHRVPASVAMGDVTGDHLPDLIQIAYVDDPNHTTKPPIDEQGNVTFTVAPSSFEPGVDYLFENQGDGSVDVLPWSSQGDARTGLGLVVGDLDNRIGNEVFIGNDSLPNRVWKLGKQRKPRDLATPLGCAYGFSGGATGAMGIAVGDFDQNSRLDLYVANYENENANLYLSKGNSFEDRNRQYKLGKASKILVAFGAQAIDYDNDGDEDLVVTNGHLDDAKSIRGTYKQPMQLFCNRGRRFQIPQVIDPSGYWDRRHVGRALATLDFNRDGLTDLVVTQVERPTALLINQTLSEKVADGASTTENHWLQLVLVGTQSERDAIGARVQLRTGEETQTRWVVSGDGYLCRNEPVIHFGLGKHANIDQIKIRWPSGRTQTMKGVSVDQRLLIVESESEVFVVD